MSQVARYEPRELWQPDPKSQVKAAELVLLSGGLHHEARHVARQRMIDWIAHARGCKRRAHEYRRWALEDEAAGRTKRAEYHHRQASKSMVWAKGAIFNAKLERSML